MTKRINGRLASRPKRQRVRCWALILSLLITVSLLGAAVADSTLLAATTESSELVPETSAVTETSETAAVTEPSEVSTLDTETPVAEIDTPSSEPSTEPVEVESTLEVAASELADTTATSEATEGSEVSSQPETEPTTPEKQEALEQTQGMIRPLAAPPGTPQIPYVDSRANGIKINLFNYSILGNQNINSHSRLRFSYTPGQESYPEINAYRPNVTQGILAPTLQNGYPRLASVDQSLAYLFNPAQSVAGRTAYTDLNRLFYREDGFYRFDSSKTYAYYNVAQGSGGNFIVYDATYPVNTGKPVGFFPFNVWDSTRTNIANNSYYNHFFGMSINAGFQMPRDRQVVRPNGEIQDLIFSFTGDDDAWVFIDGVLVLDIGGIHDARSGTINFTTGEVWVQNNPNPIVTTIEAMFARAGRTWNNADYSTHTLDFFFLERGANESNLAIDMNISTFSKDDLVIAKVVDTAYPEEHADQDFEFYLEYSTKTQPTVFHPYVGPLAISDGRTVQVGGTGREPGVFTLKAGQTATIDEIYDMSHYRVAERKLDRQRYTNVNANGVDLTPVAESDGSQFQVRTANLPIAGNERVTFTNTATKPLEVRKVWSDGALSHPEDQLSFCLLNAAGEAISYEGESVFTLDAAQDWSKTFTGLNDKLVAELTVEEFALPGYQVSYEKVTNEQGITWTITNTAEIDYGSLTVNKVWLNADGTPKTDTTPDSVTAELWRRTLSGGLGNKPAPSTPPVTEQHTVSFWVDHIDPSTGDTIIREYPLDLEVQVEDGGSVYFAGGIWWENYEMLPESEEAAIQASDHRVQLPGAGFSMPVHQVMNITADTRVFLRFGASVNGGQGLFINQIHEDLHAGIVAEEELAGMLRYQAFVESAEGELIDTVTLNAENNWQHSWDLLPQQDMNGNRYEYFIHEVQVDPDYHISYENNGGMTEGVITIQNTFKHAYGYTLPETGGRGTDFYTWGGALLMATALIGGVILKRSRKDDDDVPIEPT